MHEFIACFIPPFLYLLHFELLAIPYEISYEDFCQIFITLPTYQKSLSLPQ